MRFIITVLSLLAMVGVLLWYLVNSEYFSPELLNGDIDVWNIIVFLVLVALVLALLVALISFIIEKLFTCGRKEFPPPRRAIMRGLLAFALVALILTLHMFHFLNPTLAVLIAVLVVIGIVVLR